MSVKINRETSLIGDVFNSYVRISIQGTSCTHEVCDSHFNYVSIV